MCNNIIKHSKITEQGAYNTIILLFYNDYDKEVKENDE